MNSRALPSTPSCLSGALDCQRTGLASSWWSSASLHVLSAPSAGCLTNRAIDYGRARALRHAAARLPRANSRRSCLRSSQSRVQSPGKPTASRGFPRRTAAKTEQVFNARAIVPAPLDLPSKLKAVPCQMTSGRTYSARAFSKANNRQSSALLETLYHLHPIADKTTISCN